MKVEAMVLEKELKINNNERKPSIEFEYTAYKLFETFEKAKKFYLKKIKYTSRIYGL